MSSLFGAMRASLTALEAIQQSISVSQNNVANASSPGYARQRLGLAAMEFDPSTGLAGGVRGSVLASARDDYAEATVRAEVAKLGYSQEAWTQLTAVESAVDFNAGASIAENLNKFFASASAWSVSPNSAGAKENVYAAAQGLAESFRQTAGSIQDAASHAQQQIETTLSEINGIAERLRTYNVDRRTGSIKDAGIDAGMHVELEKLAELVDFRALWQADGTVTVLVGGEGALVVGDRRYNLESGFASPAPDAANPDAIPATRVMSESGVDITSHVTSGKLAALLSFRNQTIPRLMGDGEQPGELNRLAKAVTDRVNAVLATGFPPPPQLFMCGTSAASIAQTLQVNPTLAPAMLNAVDSTNANGVPLGIAKLASPSETDDMIDGLSYTAFFGKLSAEAGRDVANAKQDVDLRTQLTAQARNMRAETSGVSLNEEAVQIAQLQRGYQAAARMITTLDELMQIAVNIGRP